jgi:hypothetical protein
MLETVDRLARRRRIMLATYGMSFLGLQEIIFTKMDVPIAEWQFGQYACALLYVLWAGSLFYVLKTGGFPFRRTSAETRAALNDELTAVNRRYAYQAGYWLVMATIVILYIMYQFGDLGVPETLRLLFAFGIAMPATAFAGREKRQGA